MDAMRHGKFLQSAAIAPFTASCHSLARGLAGNFCAWWP